MPKPLPFIAEDVLRALFVEQRLSLDAIAIVLEVRISTVRTWIKTYALARPLPLETKTETRPWDPEEVLRMNAEGYSDRHIARHYGLSFRAAEQRITSLLVLPPIRPAIKRKCLGCRCTFHHPDFRLCNRCRGEAGALSAQFA